MRRILSGAVIAVLTLGLAPVHASAPTRPLRDAPQQAAEVSEPPRPAHDPFYVYRGDLGAMPNGTPLKARQVSLAATQTGTPITAEQILYRTTTTTGQPTATVTTVVLPATGTVDPQVVGYLSFYDALASKCNPSYTLRGGDPGEANRDTAWAEQGVVHSLNQQGYIVTVPDFETPRMDFTSGRENGRVALDGVRATLRWLDLDRSTPVGLMGYSGGSIAADWASELHPSYAPELNLVGVAEGGMPVNPFHTMRYIDGVPAWSHLTPMLLLGVARSYDLSLERWLSHYGRSVTRFAASRCIGELSDRWPRLTLQRMVRPGSRPLLRVRPLRRELRRNVMGSAAGSPRTPLLMVAAKSDDRGDGVILLADMRRLAAEYCEQGVPVTFRQVDVEHTPGGVAFMPMAMEFLAERFAGVPPTSTC